MGKAAVILVAAVTLASSAAYMAQDRQALEQVRQEAMYEHQVLAREIAQSGFNRIESRVRRDYENHRLNLSDMTHSIGTMDLSASGASGEAVSISATGYYEGAEYTISGVLSRQGSRILDALTVDAGVDDVNFRDNARVSGLDTNPDGSDGSNQDVHAVLTTTFDAYMDFTSEMEAGDGVGIGGLEDVTEATPEINLSTLGVDITNYAGSARVNYSGDTDLSDETVGSSETPVVLVVTSGDLTLSGSFQGYGVLYVDGSLRMENSARWEGLVMVENDGGAHLLKDDARVYGAVVVRSVAEDGSGDDDDRGLPGGHFDVDVFDEFVAGQKRYHEHKYDDDFDVTGVDLLDPTGCENGGLCLDEILGDEDAVYVSFKNIERGYGTYDIEANSGSVEETCNDEGSGSGDDDGGDDDDNDGGSCWWCWWSSNDLRDSDGSALQGHVSGPMPADVRAAGFSAVSWLSAMGANVLTLFPMEAGKKVQVCHVPPGNPQNAHTIKISNKAVASHLAHGDYLGECSDDDDDSVEDSGAGACDTGSVQIPSADLAGNTHEGLSPTLLDMRAVTKFQVNFEYLCALQISSPNAVIYDPQNRNGAFTIQVHDADFTGSSWTQGDLVYELSVYHHTGYGWWDDPGGAICDPSLGGGDEIVAGDPIEFEMEDNALIQYSSAALLTVKDILVQIDPGQGSITLGNVREDGVRQKERPTWLGGGLLR